MLGNSASGVSGVDAVQNNVENMDASAYTAQAQQIADAAAGQLAGVQETLNGTAGQLNAAAEGLEKRSRNSWRKIRRNESRSRSDGSRG